VTWLRKWPHQEPLLPNKTLRVSASAVCGPCPSPERRHIGKMYGEGEENRTGFDADVLVSPAGDRNARPDTVGHEQGTKTVGRHRDRRMGFILDADLAHLRAEADADRSERRETNGLCPLQRPGDQTD
jgi:hypothetical protein